MVFQRDAMTFNLILTNALDSFKRMLALVTPPLDFISCLELPVNFNWHTPKAMQSMVKMNDEYIAIDCALSVCREPGIEARLRNKKKSKQKGGEHKNGTKHTDTANKRKQQRTFANNQKEPINKDRLFSQWSY